MGPTANLRAYGQMMDIVEPYLKAGGMTVDTMKGVFQAGDEGQTLMDAVVLFIKIADHVYKDSGFSMMDVFLRNNFRHLTEEGKLSLLGMMAEYASQSNPSEPWPPSFD